MRINLTKINYNDLRARQKENYNFLKVSAVLADYGFMTMRLSDDWQGADFIAQHIDGETFLKVQLKTRLSFDRKYLGKNLYVAFPWNSGWYLYPHDEVLCQIRATGGIHGTTAWQQDGSFTFPHLSQQNLTILEPYKIGPPSQRGV